MWEPAGSCTVAGGHVQSLEQLGQTATDGLNVRTSTEMDCQLLNNLSSVIKKNDPSSKRTSHGPYGKGSGFQVRSKLINVVCIY